MKVFLDTSVLLAACGSAEGASREIFRRAGSNRWELVTTPYVLGEVQGSLSKFPEEAAAAWVELQPELVCVDDVITVDRPVVFEAAKDRPILFSALAWVEVLLTLDRNDFGALMGTRFYGLRILKPGTFLEEERAAGRLT